MTQAPHGPLDQFTFRHIGPDPAEIDSMLQSIGSDSLEKLINETIPASILERQPLNVGEPRGEHELLSHLRTMAKRNRVFKSYIGMGYHGTITPPVIQRNILENPGWYTQYTPYQAEISQGRLEALINFQTMVSDLTALPIANASLLDEATAVAEAMAMCISITRRDTFLIAHDCHPQTIEVVQTRAKSMGVKIEVFDPSDSDTWKSRGFDDVAGVAVQYPATDGRIDCYEALADALHNAKALLVAATDLLALTLIKPPGEFGADIAVGSAQRFGVPMGYGGPHAAFLATHEKHVRKMPGRLIGVSHDTHGNPAYRMAIQTREQHIKRDRATSNICTAQVLLAIMAGMYAVYHGPDGLRRIAERVRGLTQTLRAGLRKLGYKIDEDAFVFDTLRIRPASANADDLLNAARDREMNLRDFGDGTLGITLDETTTIEQVEELLHLFGADRSDESSAALTLWNEVERRIPESFARQSGYLTHPVFNTHHSETEMLRYIRTLESRDLSLCHSMIPLGSCTMKLNGTSEMLPVTWPEFANMHPFAPVDQADGYFELFEQLEDWLADMTGFAAVSLQPNAGSQGEYAGLLTIRAYHESRGETDRDVCLIPLSAHGTNPASAVIAGFRVVPIKCDDHGNIDMDDLAAKAEQHQEKLGAIMITYPSTHGVFETNIRDICKVVHDHGGLVYLDGANMNAMVGLCKPGAFGADVCHLNLHKTFCIPHGGGGPGMGPIGVVERLKPFLPGHSVVKPKTAGEQAIGALAAAPYGSPSILPISWVYIALMGSEGL
ncbi:MAG: glycine dehydrogenase (aminomethyl-transferring), partial [Phycisphaerales bacterium]